MSIIFVIFLQTYIKSENIYYKEIVIENKNGYNGRLLRYKRKRKYLIK